MHYLYTPGAGEVDPRFHPNLKHGKIRDRRDLDKVKTYADTGNPVTYGDRGLKRELIAPDAVIAHCPPSFCAYCGVRDMPLTAERGAGVWMFMDDYPAIGAKRGQAVAYFCHSDCVASEFRAGPKILQLPNNGWNRLIGSRHMKTEENITGFLKMAKITNRTEYFTRYAT
jgi:hypothetical protein